MRAATLYLLHSLLVVGVDHADAVTAVVIKPTKTVTVEAALIIVPGASITGDAYRPLAEAIQLACPLKLWVVLLKDFLLNTPNPLQLHGAISSAVDTLHQQGMSSNNIFLAGHSLGGVFVGQEGKANATRYKGVLLFASYLTKGEPLATYPIPVLTLSGDLDGQTRITRIADEFQQLEAAVATGRGHLYSTPVIVMRGVIHAQFASGVMPTKVITYDLTPEVTAQTAYTLIAGHTSAFLVATLQAPQTAVAQARAHLDAAYTDTLNIMKPLLSMKSMEGHNSDEWTIQAQLLEAGPTPQRMTITNTILSDLTAFLASKPTITSAGNAITVATFTHVTYSMNLLDISTVPSAPQELMIKMKSREAIQAVSSANHSSTVATCRSLNEAAFNLALKKSAAHAQCRFKAKGRPIIFRDDENLSTGLAWSTAELDLHEDDSGLTVTSPSLKISLHEALEALSGMHYCKVLAPYRAMEWIYVDSLRPHAV